MTAALSNQIDNRSQTMGPDHGDGGLISMGTSDPESGGAERLIPLVYDELRRLATERMRHESPGHSLQATALVHEAFVRLNASPSRHWENRGHFFAAAAEAMRRILVESARRKARLRHGGDRGRVTLDEAAPVQPAQSPELLALDESLDRLSASDPVAAQLVKLRYFAGMTVDEAAEALGMSTRTAYYTWEFARSWLRHDMRAG